MKNHAEGKMRPSLTGIVRLELQRKAFDRAVERVLEHIPDESERNLIRKCLGRYIEEYPVAIATDDGKTADHPVFLPSGYRQENYYERVMGDIQDTFGDVGKSDLYPYFKRAIEKEIDNISIQMDRIKHLENASYVGIMLKEREGKCEYVPVPKKGLDVYLKFVQGMEGIGFKSIRTFAVEDEDAGFVFEACADFIHGLYGLDELDEVIKPCLLRGTDYRAKFPTEMPKHP